MTFQSVLFPNSTARPEEPLNSPDFFGDLALDQIVADITAGKDEYDLKPFFRMPLHTVDAIAFRHEVMRDLENPLLFESLTAFAGKLGEMRKQLAQGEKLFYPRQTERYFLEAVETYCDAVTDLARDLTNTEFTSRGLSAFRDYLAGYAATEGFTTLLNQAKWLKSELSSLRYCVRINGLLVQVRKYQGESDYSAEIEETFERFKHDAQKNYSFQYDDFADMNHVEANILDLVAQLYPDVFSALKSYRTRFTDFLDATVAAFDREIQFYIAYLEHLALFKSTALQFCYPRISQENKAIFACQGFDLALAGKLIRDEAAPVCNDFHLKGKERIIVVSGPNQGGKTTFARTLGQLHYLAILGCPVPGAKAQLYLFDRLFTHFEREENIADLRGKLQDDLVRIHTILDSATTQSLVIINEIFASTTFRDATALSKKIAAQILGLDLLCVWVTFIDEVATLSEKTVSMVSTVDPENHVQRTFKIVRRPADGLAYALTVAEKYRLTYARIMERLER